MNSRNPKVFISHSSRDKERFVNDLNAALKDSDFNTFYSPQDIVYLDGDDILVKIAKELDSSSVIVIVLSRHWEESKYQIREIVAAHHSSIIPPYVPLFLVLLPDFKECDQIHPFLKGIWGKHYYEVKRNTSYKSHCDKIVKKLIGSVGRPTQNQINIQFACASICPLNINNILDIWTYEGVLIHRDHLRSDDYATYVALTDLPKNIRQQVLPTGYLAACLEAMPSSKISRKSQRDIGLAVGNQASRGIQNILEEGVKNRSIRRLSFAYRTGVIIGSFIDEDGNLRISPDAIIESLSNLLYTLDVKQLRKLLTTIINLAKREDAAHLVHPDHELVDSNKLSELPERIKRLVENVRRDYIEQATEDPGLEDLASELALIVEKASSSYLEHFPPT